MSQLRFYEKGNICLKNYINGYFPVDLSKQTASSKSQMSATANESAEAQVQDGGNTTSLDGGDVLGPHSNLMKPQDKMGVCLSSQIFTLHHLATPRHGCETPKPTQ